MTDTPTMPSYPLDGRTHVSVREARKRIAELLNRAAYGVERIVVERHGKPIAAIVCVEDLEHLEAADHALDQETLAKLDREKSASRRRRRPPKRRK
jgi:prevent-host-death family protein